MRQKQKAEKLNVLPTICLDPSVVWALDALDSPADAPTILSIAMKWMSRSQTGPLDVLFSRRSLESLTHQNAFPAEPRLTEILDILGLSGIVSPKAIAASISRFLSNARFIEDASGCLDAITADTTIAPDIVVSILNPDLREVSVNAAAFSAVCALINSRHRLYGYPRLDTSYVSLDINSTVEAAELAEDTRSIEGAIVASLGAIRDPVAWEEALDPALIWQNAGDREEIELAIWLRARTLAAQQGTGTKAFRVGTEFMASLGGCGASGVGPLSETVLTKCAMSVLNYSSLEPRVFKTSTALNAGPRIRARDQARAWRLHVTDDHEGFRLMYWETPSGSLEFATLGPKFELVIADGAILPRRAW